MKVLLPLEREPQASKSNQLNISSVHADSVHRRVEQLHCLVDDEGRVLAMRLQYDRIVSELQNNSRDVFHCFYHVPRDVSGK